LSPLRSHAESLQTAVVLNTQGFCVMLCVTVVVCACVRQLAAVTV